MIIDLKKDQIPEFNKFDVCIVGAGAAGISIAKSFIGTQFNIALIESGDFKINPETQNLYQGKATGNILKGDGYLIATRLRYFGGTTNHWGGWCRPLDDIDFQKRDWVPDSGWPIDRKDLEPYYRKAEELVEINSFKNLEKQQHKWGDPENDYNGLRTPYFQWSPPTRFGSKYKNDIINAQNITLFINSNLTKIELNSNRDRVKKLTFRSVNSNIFILEPKFTILACGAIENARILLNNRDDISDGLGNQNGIVGKYYMEHPHYLDAGWLLAWHLIKIESLGAWNEFKRGTVGNKYSERVFSVTEETQQKEKLLNFSMSFNRKLELEDESFKKDSLAFSLSKLSEKYLVTTSMFEKALMTRMVVRAEQEPRETNAVSLIRGKDKIGMNKVKLNCNVSDKEFENYGKSMKVIGRALGLQRKGRIKIDLVKDNVSAAPHHMGTTRMKNDPKKGVVDSNCKVYGLNNLFIAGSSVFPTGGFANPTLTIVALSVRLSEHLKNIMDK